MSVNGYFVTKKKKKKKINKFIGNTFVWLYFTLNDYKKHFSMSLCHGLNVDSPLAIV